jgi:hypothetical protein
MPMESPLYAGEQTNPDAPSEPATTPLEERRQRRIAALRRAEGLWKSRTDIPKDGAEYQAQLRNEWR